MAFTDEAQDKIEQAKGVDRAEAMRPPSDAVIDAELAAAKQEREAKRKAGLANFETAIQVMSVEMKRAKVLDIAAKIPQQGGVFWDTVKRIEAYLETGSPTPTEVSGATFDQVELATIVQALERDDFRFYPYLITKCRVMAGLK